jgi:hypothetical protein
MNTIKDIDEHLARFTGSEPIRMIWADTQRELQITEPGPRQFELIEMMLKHIAPAYYARLAAEVEANKDAHYGDIVSAVPLPQAPSWTVAKILSDFKIASWSVVRALGADATRTECERQIAECLADNLVP